MTEKEALAEIRSILDMWHEAPPEQVVEAVRQAAQTSWVDTDDGDDDDDETFRT